MRETRILEFKETITNTFLKTISAFSNYDGGTILFGVDDDGNVKELFVFFIFIKVKIGSIFIITLAELFQNPSFAYLTDTFQNQRFAVGRVLPVKYTLTDFVIEFAEYEFFCHEMIKKELSRHELNPDPNPWLEEKVKAGKVKLYTDREIVSELGKLYGKEATSIYLELLETSCDTFNANFYKQYYGSLNEMECRH